MCSLTSPPSLFSSCLSLSLQPIHLSLFTFSPPLLYTVFSSSSLSLFPSCYAPVCYSFHSPSPLFLCRSTSAVFRMLIARHKLKKKRQNSSFLSRTIIDSFPSLKSCTPHIKTHTHTQGSLMSITWWEFDGLFCCLGPVREKLGDLRAELVYSFNMSEHIVPHWASFHYRERPSEAISQPGHTRTQTRTHT